MFESNIHTIIHNNAEITAQNLINTCFFDEQEYCIFLDIDGTISEFDPDPQQSFISNEIIHNLIALQHLGVIVMAVTGRTITEAKRLFSPLSLPIAGTHGLEIQLSAQSLIQVPESDVDFNQIHLELEKACEAYPQLYLEKKAYASVIHFRAHPELDEVAQHITHTIAAQHPEIRLNAGKCVYELMLKDADKGQAISRLYQSLNLSNLIPIFIGDDHTDESGFDAINQLDGLSIKVGDGLTSAQFRFKNVGTTADFIQYFKEYMQKKSE